MDLVSTHLANTSYGNTSLNTTITINYQLLHAASHYANMPEWEAYDAIAGEAFTLAQVQYDLTTFWHLNPLPSATNRASILRRFRSLA
jgi:hypothetical protein